MCTCANWVSFVLYSSQLKIIKDNCEKNQQKQKKNQFQKSQIEQIYVNIRFYDDRLFLFALSILMANNQTDYIPVLFTLVLSHSRTRQADVDVVGVLVAIVLEFKTQCYSLSFKYSHNYLKIA